MSSFYNVNIIEEITKHRKTKPSNQHELLMVHTLSSDQKMFNFYKNSDLVAKIKQVVPITELSNKCTQRMLSMQSANTNCSETIDNQKPLESRDVFFLLLLEWFKTEFFTWFDSGYCTSCEIPMKLSSRRPADGEEASWLASNVEVYTCSKCQAIENFPRYNHPIKLLETRKGRCGEWRNCFSAICVTFNYTIRLVTDFQDHVWNEIYLDSQKRWIHFDCCENVFDTPLMYEVGWGKKLIYCIASSQYECQDVTMRYTRDHLSVLDRRQGRCRPDWLNYYLLHISSKLQRKCDESLKLKLLNRRFAELSSLIVIPGMEKKLKENEKQSRTSGSIAWRVARGECSTNQSSHVIRFNKHTNDDSHRFTYQSVLDIYLTDGDKLSGWSSATFSCENIYKKVERDWKMTYLCRRENSNCLEKGFLTYKFDVRFDWTFLMVKIDSKTYETGQISARLTSEPKSVDIPLKLDEINSLNRSDFTKEIDYLLMTITLSGGSGDIGWQQAQLFRKSTLGTQDDYSLDVIFTK
ncbi:peptide-N(4)-(N-acetyl-beta-glucosaminyl)asparagine amidase-like [Panonychus citri]|uniref:peptide-N(4)-(N-acetyl-beta- glucosaminyl)asparagine amidase-like n=1 Tax=Panonychus citri TaxID=50023 RepID=UPI00230789B1|nr:peptide-N(4)-(N-acetyl-beta-glucosaminyl)asparagine amidase-like [Panonychus citri]